MRRLANAFSLLSQGCRWWAILLVGQCWPSVVSGGPPLGKHCVNVLCLLCGCYQVTPERLIHVAGSLGSPQPPSLPQLTSRGVLCNIEVRSWLRYLSSTISNFVLLKVDFWPWQLKALQIHIIYTFVVCNTTEKRLFLQCPFIHHLVITAKTLPCKSKRQ